MKIERSQEFDKNLKSLLKNHGTLESDLQHLVDALANSPSPKSKSNLRILKQDGDRLYGLKAYLYCASLKTDRKIRVIYIHDVEGQRVRLIEIYMKGSEDRYDKKRLERYFSEFLYDINKRGE